MWNEASGRAFLARGREDRRQFRFIVAPPRIPRTGRPHHLDWIAGNHHDTGHLHSHVILRGATDDGKILRIAESPGNWGHQTETLKNIRLDTALIGSALASQRPVRGVNNVGALAQSLEDFLGTLGNEPAPWLRLDGETEAFEPLTPSISPSPGRGSTMPSSPRSGISIRSSLVSRSAPAGKLVGEALLAFSWNALYVRQERIQR